MHAPPPYHRPVTPDLRHLRTFVTVAECGSFTRAAEDLYIAQQAVSQQIKALEAALGVTLLRRTSRRVELTPAGQVFLADSRRVLSAADRAVRRVQEAARGEAGTVRIAYTVTAAYQTIPALLSRLGQRYPQLKAQAREVFAHDIARLLRTGQCDVGIGPAAGYPGDLRQQLIRWEAWQLAVGAQHPLAGCAQAALQEVSTEQVELWPREMAPGYYDAVMSACRAAGFEPRIDHDGAGSTVWGYIAQGRGIGLVVSSLAEQLPPGITLIEIAPPAPPPLGITAVWQPDDTHPAVERFLEAAAELAAERGWA
jgi:DNA-binding transcriptional LysR family regulator